MTPRLLERYRTDVHAKLTTEFGYRNPLQVPTLSKIIVNVGLGEAAANPKLLERAAEELAVISGQKPIIRRAR
jgi:large subunit ribosomal protein L5